MDCNLPGTSVHGIFQARILEWVAIAFSIAWVRVGLSLRWCPSKKRMHSGRPPRAETELTDGELAQAAERGLRREPALGSWLHTSDLWSCENIHPC